MSREIRGISEEAFVLTSAGYRKAGTILPGDAVVSESFRPVAVNGVAVHSEAARTVRYRGSIPTAISSETRYLTCFEDDAAPASLGVPIPTSERAYPWSGIEVSDGYYRKLRHELDSDDPALWTLAGLFLRSGTLIMNTKGGRRKKYQGVSVYANAENVHFIEDAVGGRFSHTTYRNTSSWESYTVMFYGTELAAFMEAFGAVQKDKAIPLDAFYLGVRLKRALIGGYMLRDADELSETEGIHKIVSGNVGLALGMSHLIESVYGPISSINEFVSGKRRTEAFGRSIDWNSFSELRFRTDGWLPQSVRAEEDYAWYPLVSNKEAGENAFIDLSVDGDEGIIVNRMVFL